MDREDKILDIVRQTAHYLDKTGVSMEKMDIIAPFLRELNYKTHYYIRVIQSITSFRVEVQEYNPYKNNYNTLDCWTWPVVS